MQGRLCVFSGCFTRAWPLFAGGRAGMLEPPSVCFVTHVCRVWLKREDADARRVHPAQWLFPPNTPRLADMRRRLDPAEPHLPHLHHVGHVHGASHISSTSFHIVDNYFLM